MSHHSTNATNNGVLINNKITGKLHGDLSTVEDGRNTTMPVSPSPIYTSSQQKLNDLTRGSAEIPAVGKGSESGKTANPSLRGTKGKGKLGGVPKPVKKPRFKPGMLALQEIKRLQAQTENILPRLPF